MSEFHFKNCLNKNYIDGLKDKLGFNDVTIIEQFIMDYEMLYHILREIPNPIIKGGMSVPFHVTEMRLRRLSQDIDLVTNLSKEEVEKAMMQVGMKTNDLFTIMAPHKPPNPVKNLPLLTYYVPFKTNIGTLNPLVQIDILYDFKEEVPTKPVTPGEDLIGFKLDYPFVIFDKNALIGDKLTTLGFQTIGLIEEKRSNVIKHIYDISSLIREITEKSDIDKIGSIYQSMANYENSFLDGKKFTLEEMIDDALASLDSLLVAGTGYSLESSHRGRYYRFINQLLGRDNSYSRSDHIIDILLIKLLAKYMQLVIIGSMGLSEFTNKFYQDIVRLNEIATQNERNEIQKTRNEIIGQFDIRDKIKFIKTLPQNEQVFLYSRIEQMGR